MSRVHHLHKIKDFLLFLFVAEHFILMVFAVLFAMNVSHQVVWGPVCLPRRCRRADGHLPLHDRCVRPEVSRRVQPARPGLDGQQSVSGHRLFGHAVHWSLCPAPHLPHSGEIHLHRVSLPLLDSWLAAHRLHPARDMGVWFYSGLSAAGLQGTVSQLLWDKWRLLPSALGTARDALGSRLLHCHFPWWGFLHFVLLLLYGCWIVIHCFDFITIIFEIAYFVLQPIYICILCSKCKYSAHSGDGCFFVIIFVSKYFKISLQVSTWWPSWS